jgi:hypothetical protein
MLFTSSTVTIKPPILIFSGIFMFRLLLQATFAISTQPLTGLSFYSVVKEAIQLRQNSFFLVCLSLEAYQEAQNKLFFFIALGIAITLLFIKRLQILAITSRRKPACLPKIQLYIPAVCRLSIATGKQ